MKEHHFGIQNMGSTINIKAAMEPRNFESACRQPLDNRVMQSA